MKKVNNKEEIFINQYNEKLFLIIREEHNFNCFITTKKFKI